MFPSSHGSRWLLWGVKCLFWGLGLRHHPLIQTEPLNRTPLPLWGESTCASPALTFLRAVDSELGSPRRISGGPESSHFLRESFKGIQYICLRAGLRGIRERTDCSSWWQP